jgi:hypothetical protein
MLLLTLISVHLLAMDQQEHKQEIHYDWKSVVKINERGAREYPSFTVPMSLNATLADLKRAIAEQRDNRNFDLDIYFNTTEREPSWQLGTIIESYVPGSTASASSKVFNLVQVACPETVTLKTLMDVGPKLPTLVIGHVIFRAVPK